MKIGDLFRKQSQTKAFPSQDNVSFYQLEPEVAGGWGEDTVADTTMQPPRVLQLDYCFDGWLGDDLLESFPVWIVTEKLAFLLQGSSLTGFTLGKMKTSYSEEFIDKQSCINLYCNIEKVCYVICNSNRRGTDEDNSYSNNGPGTSKVAGIAPKVRRLPQ